MALPRCEIAILCIFLFALVCAAEGDKKRRTPAPISVPFSQYWDGSDGEWSSFSLSLSGPGRSQTIRVFPSTTGYQIWAVSPLGCPAAWPGGVEKCELQRGGLFNFNYSSTWTPKSPYIMGNMASAHAYGYDNLTLDFGWEDVAFGMPGARDSSDGALKHIVVGQLTQWNFTTLGLLGLDPKPTNFTDTASYSGGQPSLLWTLRNQSVIPSLSYSYTAGAKYKVPPVFGSLVLGGYDKNRRTALGTGGRFRFYDDVEIPLMVNLLSITTNTQSGSLDLGDGALPVMTKIDSTRPWIYLPYEICMQLAKQLNLTYDSKLQYLYVDSTSRNALMKMKPNFIFALAVPRMSLDVWAGSGTGNVSITLPIEALIQKLDYPLVPASTKMWHIPIRPTNDTDQYMLGRTFLQQAHLQVNYEDRVFEIYPADFPPSGTKEELIPISGATRVEHLPSSIIVGIAAGGTVLVLIIASAIFCCCRRKLRRKREQKEAESRKIMEVSSPLSPSTTLSPTSPYTMKGFEAMELDSAIVHESGGLPSTRAELQNNPSSPIVGELDSASTAFGGFYKELKGNGQTPIIKVYYEMDASPPGSAGNTPTSTLSNLSTLVGTDNLPSIQDMLSPIPQTPQEYYDRPAPPVRAGDRSSIPQTPLEFYGPAAMEGRAGQRGWIGRAPVQPPRTSSVAAVVGAGVGVAAAAPGARMPRVTLTPATPASPSEHERQRSRWLRGHSGRRKERNGEDRDGKSEKI